MMSPRISPVPFRAPNRVFGRSSTGTSFETGLPFLVIVTGSPLLATWSMIFRHFALNSEALIVVFFFMTMVMTMVTRSFLQLFLDPPVRDEPHQRNNDEQRAGENLLHEC